MHKLVKRTSTVPLDIITAPLGKHDFLNRYNTNPYRTSYLYITL